MQRNVLALALVLVLPSTSYAGAFDARRAERALILALEAELAGDAVGARTALEALRNGANAPEEYLGRAVVDKWLNTQRLRIPAWKPSAGKQVVLRAWQSLDGFSRPLQDRVWQFLCARRSHLRASLEPIVIRLDRIYGLAKNDFYALLVRNLRRSELEVHPEGLEFSLTLDSQEEGVRGRWVVARADVAFVLSSTITSEPPLARFARSRTERRRNRAQAVRVAAGRLTKDVVNKLSWKLRERALLNGW